MRLYGLHDPSLGRIVEWYTSLEAMERELEALASDEPAWASQLEVVTFSLKQSKPAPLADALKRTEP